jgi:hypothetical protein
VLRPAVLVYSGFTYTSFYATAIERGAIGYLSKDQPVESSRRGCPTDRRWRGRVHREGVARCAHRPGCRG